MILKSANWTKMLNGLEMEIKLRYKNISALNKMCKFLISFTFLKLHLHEETTNSNTSAVMIVMENGFVNS